MLRRAVLLAALALALSLARPVQADEVTAREAMQRGVAALTAGDAARALPEFQRAIAELPDAPVPHRYAAETLEKLQRWAEAITEYETYLRLRPDSRDAAEVRARVAHITNEYLTGELAVHCAPAGAEIEIDGSPAGLAPLAKVRVRGGVHNLRVMAAGHLAKNLAVTVAAGDRTVVDCTLDPVSPPRPPPPADEPSPPDVTQPEPPPTVTRRASKVWYRRPWVWAVAGAAVVAGGVGVYFALPDRPETAGGDIHFPP